MNRERRSRPGRPISAGAPLVAFALGAAGCQVVFGLDGYKDAPPSSPPPPPSCADLAPPMVSAAGSGIRGVRKLAALSDPAAAELTAGGYCVGGACYVFYQRRTATDQMMCARCADLSALNCDDPVVAKAGFHNVSVRAGQSPEVLALNGAGQMVRAPLDPKGSCTVGAATLIGAAIPLGAYPVLSPNGKVLVFGGSRIQISHADASGNFIMAAELGGIHDATVANSFEVRPMPVWLDNGEAFDTIYFSSTRLAADPSSGDALDVFIAHRSMPAPYNLAFEAARLVPQLSGPGTDFPPQPLSETQWLWNFGRLSNLPDSDLFVIDMGLSPIFGAPLPQAFAVVNTPNADEDGPALDDDHLFFARTPKSGLSRLFTAGTSAGIGAATAIADLGTPATAADRDPFPLPDGRLLFVSDRDGGVPKIWVKAPGASTVTRATTTSSATAEGTPFVDEAGTLWLSWGGGSDPAAKVIARALPSGAAWGEVSEVSGLGHEVGAVDESPRLLAGARTLVFASTRVGGFFDGVSSIWAAQRPDPAGDAWAQAFPIPELSTVNGVTGPFPSPDGCSITVASVSRSTSFLRDLASAARKSP